MPGKPGGHPLDGLDEAERDLVLHLVLASGSLKELARVYGVSYPTIRARLDRVIARLRELQAGRRPDPMAELLARLVERGEVTVTAARAIRALHREQASRAIDEDD